MGICKISALKEILLTNNKLDVVVSLDEVKSRFGVAGKYQKWWNFNNYYLFDAVKWVGLLSQFDVTYTPVKSGNKVTHIHFRLSYRRSLQDRAERRTVKPARVRSYGARPLSSTAN